MKLGPKAIATRFRNGEWISMIADKTGASEGHIEIQLMRFMRSLRAEHFEKPKSKPKSKEAERE